MDFYITFLNLHYSIIEHYTLFYFFIHDFNIFFGNVYAIVKEGVTGGGILNDLFLFFLDSDAFLFLDLDDLQVITNRAFSKVPIYLHEFFPGWVEFRRPAVDFYGLFFNEVPMVPGFVFDAQELTPLLIFLVLAILLALIILGASVFFAVQKPDTEKLSIYECGFDPYEDSRNKFDIRFYIIAILFIIFDLETIFCFPWIMSLGISDSLAFWAMMDFLLELVVGFVYVWCVGALIWE